MASTYLEAIAGLPPASGPLLLAGWSIGGAIAWEMAQRLVRQGREVGLLALIDSFAPSVLTGGATLDEEDLRAEAGMAADADPPLARRLRRVHQANVTAVLRYRPAPYDGRVALLRATDRPKASPAAIVAAADPTLGWGALAPRLAVHAIAGDHGSILREPAVGELAVALEALVSGSVPA